MVPPQWTGQNLSMDRVKNKFLVMYYSGHLNGFIVHKGNCEFPTALICRLFGTLAPLCICYQEVFHVFSSRAICRLWHPLPQGQGIPYLSTYSYILYDVLMSPYVATRHVLSRDFDQGIDVLN